MVVAHDRREGRRAGKRRADPGADLGVLAHELPLVRVEGSRLGEDGFGDPDLADIVQQCAVGDRFELGMAEAELGPQAEGHVRESLAVPLGQ